MTLFFELGIAVALILGILLLKPEYGLFFYGLALGFPDIALPLGTTINLRLDDGLILLFLLRSMVWTPAPLAPGQRKIMGAQALFLLACLLSAVVGVARGTAPASYETAKMIGCAAIALALPRLVQSVERLRFLIAGLMCAGFALVIQIHQHLGAASMNSVANFQELKNAAAFSTWNPNTIGQASALIIFAAGLGSIVFSHSWPYGIVWPCLAMGFSLVPLTAFVRGTSLSIAAGLILFLCLTRRWKWVLLFAAVGFSAILYLHSVDREMLDDAASVDLTTGEGLSHRFDRWAAATEAIQTQPLLGQGFGQEWTYLSGAGSEGRAHDAYMTVWLELGLGGLALFAAMIYQFVFVGLSLYRNPDSRICGASILALIATFSIDSLGLPTLYWEKLPVIALSIAVSLVGLCQRKRLETSPIHVRSLGQESLPQCPENAFLSARNQ